MSKLIVLSGFAASGKTTIGQRYLKDHPLTLFIEGDELIVNLGQWVAHEDEARRITFELMKSMAKTQLELGYDVLWPLLLTDASHMAEIEVIADDVHAETYEFILHSTKEVAITRLLERGWWGEVGLEALTEKDLPEIEDLYDRMVHALAHRSQAIPIDVTSKSIEDTYSEIMSHI